MPAEDAYLPGPGLVAGTRLRLLLRDAGGRGHHDADGAPLRDPPQLLVRGIPGLVAWMEANRTEPTCHARRQARRAHLLGSASFWQRACKQKQESPLQVLGHGGAGLGHRGQGSIHAASGPVACWGKSALRWGLHQGHTGREEDS